MNSIYIAPEFLFISYLEFVQIMPSKIQASHLWQMARAEFYYVMVIIFHDNALLSYWNPVPIHDSYETIRSS